MKNLTLGPIAGAVVFSAALTGCVEDPSDPAVSTVRIGALLPFSGDLAASGINLERPLIMAAEAINGAGGIDGRDVSVLTVDSNRYFPNPEEGFDVHQATLRDFLLGNTNNPLVGADERIIPGAGVDAIVGPLVPELSLRLAAEARLNQVVHMSANVVPQSNVTGRCSFSLFPSFRVLGIALGQRMVEDGVASASVVYLDDDFHTKLLGQLQAAFTGSDTNPRMLFTTPTTTGKADYRDDLRLALQNDPAALVLLAPPRLAARLVADITALEEAQPRLQSGSGNPLGWYFGPLLRVEDFPKNVLGGVLAGGVGVAPGVDLDRAQSFREAFVDRWETEPTLDAHYIYDTMTVLLLALRAAAASNPGQNLTTETTYEASCAAVEATTTGGSMVSPTDALSGSAFGQAGADVDYIGLTGPVEINERGNSGDGLVEIWRVLPDGDTRIETVSVRSTRDLLSDN